MSRLLLALVLGAAATSAAAEPRQAAQQPDAISSSGGSVRSSSDWEVSAVPYFWLAGMKGDIGAIPNTQPVGVDISFGDIFKHLKLVFMGQAEARHGRLVLLGDVVWMKVGAEKSLSIRDRDFLDGSLRFKSLVATGLAGYRVVSQGPVTIDLSAGGRLDRVGANLKLSGPNRTAQGSVVRTWVDPIVAARATADIAPRLSLSIYGDAGGAGIGSRFTWQAWGMVNYNVSGKTKIGAGWRHYAVNYDKNDFLFDVRLDGPIVGATFTF
jgi:hypothetical protein